MSLEFKEIVPQIQKMGAMLEKLDFDLGDRLRKAFDRFEQASDLEVVRERIEWVRQSSVSGYRGAAPLDITDAEPVNYVAAAPEPPASATLVAADGSQIYPNEQSPVHYFLLNMGALVYHHGSERTPEPFTSPRLFFHKDHVHDKYGRLIRNRAVDDRRTIAEIQYLAERAWACRDEARPLVALYDNRLMFQSAGEQPENAAAFRAYMGALVHLHDAGAVLAGYVDNPLRGERFIRLLYLLSLESEEELHARQHGSPAGDLEGLRDATFFRLLLQPGERSAIMVQNSPRNLEFKERGVNYEIAFFYLNVGSSFTPHIVRVDIPLWVARDARAVNDLHGLLLAQCRIQGRNPYPYVLTRAHELAVVSKDDERKLEELIKTQLRVSTDLPVDSLYFSAKARSKFLLRSDRRRFDTRTITGD
jgi:hypothetical protein